MVVIKNTWMTHITRERSRAYRYGWAIAWAGLALGLDLALHPLVERMLFFMAIVTVIISSTTCGYGPGLLTTLLTALGLNFFITGEYQPIQVESEEQLLRVTLFILAGFFVALLGGSLRAALLQAE